MYILSAVCELGWSLIGQHSHLIPKDDPFSFLFSLSQTSNSCHLIVLTFPGN